MQLEVNKDVFGSYAFYSGILIVKILIMAALTARHRFQKMIFMNPEDLFIKGSKVKFDDADIERVRRAHLNDLENILPFFVIALLYCFTNPTAGTANLLFKVFAFARILHTIVYAIVPLPQPSRVIAFGAGMAVNMYMAFKVIAHFA